MITNPTLSSLDPDESAGPIAFVKAHACGNDFLIIEESAANRRHAALAKRLCARSTSIGADGIEFLNRQPDRKESPAADLFLRLFNADGSEAELSGNGTRCVAAWLAASEDMTEIAFDTHGGLRTCRIVETAGSVYQIESAMGVPRVMPRTLDLGTPGLDRVEGAMVNVGNPHFVLFVETADFSAYGVAWQQLGRTIAESPLFPHGTNVEFVRIRAADQIDFRIYERGCGPTASSGTGTCASSAAAIALRGANGTLTATAPGGSQRVVWPARDQPMLLTGPSELICRGEAWL